MTQKKCLHEDKRDKICATLFVHVFKIKLQLTGTAQLNFIVETGASVRLHRRQTLKSRCCVQERIGLRPILHCSILFVAHPSNFDLGGLRAGIGPVFTYQG